MDKQGGMYLFSKTKKKFKKKLTCCYGGNNNILVLLPNVGQIADSETTEL
jgi:hypothetical protein